MKLKRMMAELLNALPAMTAMPKIFLTIFLAMLIGPAFAHGSSRKIETRCGWFDNPTPGNAWLRDRDGEWIISIQGDYEAAGDWPQFKDSQWVPVNRSHGYGCACIKAVANAETHRIVRIVSAKARPLGACRKDPALREPSE